MATDIGDKYSTCGQCKTLVVDGTMCPWMVTCPHCGAGPEKQCIRPSMHKASEMHKARYERAEQMDREKGIVYGW